MGNECVTTHPRLLGIEIIGAGEEPHTGLAHNRCSGSPLVKIATSRRSSAGRGTLADKLPPMSTKRDRSRPAGSHDSERRNATEEYELVHSIVRVEYGPAGAIARIDRPDGRDYAGPLPRATLQALREVSE